MVTRRFTALVFVVAGCKAELQLNLVINDPCNQAVLADPGLGLDHIELQIAAPGLDRPETMVWSRSAGNGEVDQIPPVAEATLSVMGRASHGGGSAGDVLAAIGVGLVDLSGQGSEDNTVNLHVVFGKVDHFFFTTDAEAASGGDLICSRLAAERRGHSASLLADGRVFIAGGMRREGTTSRYWETTELFDPRSGLHARGPDMRWVREAHTATVLADGRVFIAGGIGINGTALDTWRVALIYDPANGAFLPPVTLLTQRANHTATLLDDGRVLLAGGTLGASELDTSEIVDVRGSTATTCAGPRLAETRAFHAAERVAGSVVALIGGRGSGQRCTAAGVLCSVEFVTVDACRVDPQLVIVGPDLTVARSHVMVALVPGESAILVAGGFGTVLAAPEDGSGLRAVELIRIAQPLAASTVACSSLLLTEGRGAGSLATLPEGLLLAGGVGDAGQLNTSAEVVKVNSIATCDVSIGATAGGLGMARAGAVPTVLMGGDVLFSGGFGRANSQTVSLSQGEMYVRAR